MRRTDFLCVWWVGDAASNWGGSGPPGSGDTVTVNAATVPQPFATASVSWAALTMNGDGASLHATGNSITATSCTFDPSGGTIQLWTESSAPHACGNIAILSSGTVVYGASNAGSWSVGPVSGSGGTLQLMTASVGVSSVTFTSSVSNSIHIVAGNMTGSSSSGTVSASFPSGWAGTLHVVRDLTISSPALYSNVAVRIYSKTLTLAGGLNFGVSSVTALAGIGGGGTSVIDTSSGGTVSVSAWSIYESSLTVRVGSGSNIGAVTSITGSCQTDSISPCAFVVRGSGVGLITGAGTLTVTFAGLLDVRVWDGAVNVAGNAVFAGSGGRIRIETYVIRASAISTPVYSL